MNEGWQPGVLGDFIELKRGYDLPTRLRAPGRFSIVSSSGVTGTHNESKVAAPGVVTGRYGTIGEVFYLEEEFWPLNTTLYVRDFRGNDPRFIAYFLKTFDYSAYSDKAAVPGVNRNHLHQAKVTIPPFKVQREIAATLAAIDTRIELNRQTARTLEELAQRLFKSWFVDFDPVRAKMSGRQPAHMPPETAALFPDKFVDSPLAPIPQGWRFVPMEELAKLDTESVKPAAQPNALWTHFSIPAFDSWGMPISEMGSQIKSGKYRVKPNAVLVSKLNPGDWRAWLPVQSMIDEVAICSTEFMQFVPHKDRTYAFLWGLVNSAPFKAAVMETVSGTTGSRQRAQPKQVKLIQVIRAPEKLISTYADVVDPLMKRKALLMREVRALFELRDRLLPRLMSGQIRVPESQEAMEEALP